MSLGRRARNCYSTYRGVEFKSVKAVTLIPKTAEYALRAVVVLAREPQRAYSAEQIAKATRVPRAMPTKSCKRLVQAELVRSQSGPGGGYALAPAEKAFHP